MNELEIKELNLPQPFETLLLKTRTNTLGMSYNPRKELKLIDSKLGGKPYIPINEEHPRNPDGSMMTLLFQLNFSEVFKFSGGVFADILPSKGVLQIFIDSRTRWFGTDSYGKALLPSDTYQVRYWEDVSGPTNIEATEEYSKILCSLLIEDVPGFSTQHYLPYYKQNRFGIDFKLKPQSISAPCVEYNRLDEAIKIPPFEQFIEQTKPSDYELEGIESYSKYFEDYEYPANLMAFYSYYLMGADLGGSQILGYPRFAQYDIRLVQEELQDHIMLFQLHSCLSEPISWGDCGTAHFFIHPEDLKNKDFSKLVYYWDCT